MQLIKNMASALSRRFFVLVVMRITHLVLASECDPSVPYVSLGFVPCQFTFYTSAHDKKESDFTCDLLVSGDVLSIEDRDVLFWPDSCISSAACYTAKKVKDLKSITKEELQDVNDTDIDKRIMNEFVFPEAATHVVVNCTEDSKRVVGFAEAAGTVFAVSFIVSLVVAMCACAGVCACVWCWCCRGRRTGPVSEAPSGTYAPVPAYAVQTGLGKGQPEADKQSAKYGSV